MNVIKLFALHVIVSPKSLGNTFKWCDMFLLYFHSENANKHGAPHLPSRQNMPKPLELLNKLTTHGFK